MRPTGATNPISILLLVAALAGIYWAVLAGPKYLDNLTVREIAETTIPQAYQASETEAGREPQSMLPGETRKAFEARIAALEAPLDLPSEPTVPSDHEAPAEGEEG